MRLSYIAVWGIMTFIYRLCIGYDDIGPLWDMMDCIIYRFCMGYDGLYHL